TITITGGLTNSGNFFLRQNGDVANVATLTNTGTTSVATGATLNLISQPNGITDAVAGSTFDLAGTFNAGGNSGFANLNNVEGTVNLYGQNFTDTPGSGTLTNTGTLTANSATALTISGNVNNSGLLATGLENSSGGDTLTITGMLSNNSGGTLDLLGAGDKGSIGNGMSNAGLVDVDNGSTLKITGNVNNSGTLETSSYYGTGDNTITITGGLTNSGDFFLRQSGDVANIGSLANTANIQIGSGASLNIAGSTDTNSGTVTLYGGTLSSPSSAGNFDNTGTVQTNSGSAASTIANGGTVNVASCALLGLGKGMFAAGGGFQQLANGTLNEIIGSTASFGVLNITGPVSLAGLLNITLLNGFNPTNDSFTFVNFTGSLTGGFSNGPKFTEDGYSWTITYGANDIILTAGAIAQNYTATWSNGSGNWTDATRWTCNPSLSPCVPNNN